MGQVSSIFNPGDLYGMIRMDHSSPKEFNARLREAVTYISAVKACIVFSDTGLYHRIFEVMTKSILVVAQNLTDSQDTVDKLVKVS